MSDNDRATRVQIALAGANDRTGFFDHQTPERINAQIEAALLSKVGLLMDGELRNAICHDLAKIGCREIDVQFFRDGRVTVSGKTALLDPFEFTLCSGSEP